LVESLDGSWVTGNSKEPDTGAANGSQAARVTAKFIADSRRKVSFHQAREATTHFMMVNAL